MFERMPESPTVKYDEEGGLSMDLVFDEGELDRLLLS